MRPTASTPLLPEMAAAGAAALSNMILLAPGLTASLSDARRWLDEVDAVDGIAQCRALMQKIAQALRFVGEPSLAAFVNAIDLLLEDTGEDWHGDKKVVMASRACSALLHYLNDASIARPLRLFSIYKAMLAMCGREKIHPMELALAEQFNAAELHFPAMAEPRSAPAVIDVAACRTEFERLLLDYLRSDHVDAPYLPRMADLIGSILDTPLVSAQQNFWRVIDAVMRLFASRDIEVDQYGKKFLGQINLQLRRLVAGVCDGDLRLLREGLFFIALAPAHNQAATTLKRAIGLPDLCQADYQENYDIDSTVADTARSAALAELAHAVARTEDRIEVALNESGEALDAANALRELAAVAAALQFHAPAAMLAADALALETMASAGEATTTDASTVDNVVRNLAALSLSLPLMAYAETHADKAAEPEAQTLSAPAQPAHIQVVAAVPDGPPEEEIDLELLDIFLQEAEEILVTLARALSAARKAPEDMAHVTVLRRGFHTLKGSSRMVGLQTFGEAAMAVEAYLNAWLTHARPGSASDYALLDHAAQEVAAWLGDIRDHHRSARRPEGLMEAVAQAERDHGIAAEVASAPATDVTPALRIGDMLIPAKLHEIYCDESAALLGVLAAHFSQWRQTLPRVIAPEALRASHSLKSSAASVQFVALQAIAQPLDDVMQLLSHFTEGLDADMCSVLAQIVHQLQAMQQKFAARQMPSAREDLRRQVQAMLDALVQRRRSALDDARRLTPDQPPVSPDEIDPELLEIFLEEGRDLLPQIGESLHKLQKSPEDRALIHHLLRPLHTIKGSARMAGALPLGQHMHELESRIGEIVRDGAPSPAQIDELLARYDLGLQLFEALQEPSTPAPLPEASAEPSPAAATPATSESGVALAAAAGETESGKSGSVAPLVRIRAGILDNLLNQAGEISISRSGLESEINVLRRHLADLGGNVGRLSTQLREVEIQAEIQIAASNQRQPQNQHFDPLEFDRFTHLQELTRMMAESVNDVSSLQKNLLEAVENTQNSLVQQARLTREMQQELMQARMVQFRGAEERLHRLVRQMAKETGKDIALDIVGSAVEIDRSILEKMVGPLEHLLRNAAAHGIEATEQRRAAGKAATGRLSLQVTQEGHEVMIRLSDDGQGLDLTLIRDKAVRLGLIDSDQQLSDAELSGIIFQAGFTTSADVTAIAGRGVGMDVVRSEVASLGGRISIDTVAGRGATFIIHLPLSLAVTQVVLLELGEQTFGIPSLLVEQVVQLKTPEQAAVFSEGSLDWQGRKLPVHYLSVLLGEDAGVPRQASLPILVVKSGHDFVAILVDRIIGNREVVTKNIGPQLAHMVGVVGATVLGSGSIVLILNPIQLAQRHDYRKILRQIDPAVADSSNGKDTILVVDDSLTVRRVMQRLLMREGYHVVLATDGVDALSQLQSMRPAIALVDIEMPRMDGFDLVRHLRDMPDTATLPIIMITSRTAAKHRERAMELGVNEYLGKPYQDEVLLKMIRSLIDEDGVHLEQGVHDVLFNTDQPPPAAVAAPDEDR